jgi:hypothetical protein
MNGVTLADVNSGIDEVTYERTINPYGSKKYNFDVPATENVADASSALSIWDTLLSKLRDLTKQLTHHRSSIIHSSIANQTGKRNMKRIYSYTSKQTRKVAEWY